MKKARKVYAGVFLGLAGSPGPNRNVPWRASANSRRRRQFRARYPAWNSRRRQQFRAPGPFIEFSMLRSAAAIAGNCLANAQGQVRVVSLGPVEVMTVDVEGLPPNTEFDFFVIQIPNAPFGLAWYQGDIETNNLGGGVNLSRGASTSRHS